MGPYCKFCGTRCFVHLPTATPEHVIQAYGTVTIAATCAKGQQLEKSLVGFCYSDIQSMINAAHSANIVPKVRPKHAEQPASAVSQSLDWLTSETMIRQIERVANDLPADASEDYYNGYKQGIRNAIAAIRAAKEEGA